MHFLPEKVCDLLGLNPFNVEPSNTLGNLFKKMIKERKDKGIKYNDLAEQMQQQIKEQNLDISEDTVIGNVLLSFFGKRWMIKRTD